MISQQQASTFALLANINNVYLGFHEIAQINLAHQLFEKKESPVLEYEIISKTQKNKWGWPKRYEADLVSRRRVWEVKPVGKSGRSDLNRYMSEGDLQEGRNLYSMTDIPVFGNFKMKISVVGGLANYSFYCYDFQGNAVPVLSKDVKAAYENNANNAAKAFASIAGLTILEDLITGGYGVVDDPPSLTLALGAAAAALT